MHFLLLDLYFLCLVEGLEIIWDNSIDQLAISDGKINTDEGVMRISNRHFMYPGTKWCGPGNISAGDDDLGMFVEVDKCCRAHDQCPDVIGAYQTKYNLTNDAFYTRLHCECDSDFYSCLKAVEDFQSLQVGTIYFGVLNTKCFEKNYPITGCAHYIHFPYKKCVEYIFDDTAEELYQWFDVPNY